jgi:Ca2+/H+ antiporter, TMEM165/GDT1 family
MSELGAYLTVLVAAAIPWLEVLLVVPAGVVAGLPPIPTAVVGAVGNTLTLLPLIVGGDRIRTWWRARRRRRGGGDDGDEVDRDTAPSGRGARAKRAFDRYGLPGLAMLGPLLTGVHVAAVAALAAGAERRATAVWLTAGLVVWSFLAAGLTAVGIDAFVDPDALPDLLREAQAAMRSTTQSTQAV